MLGNLHLPASSMSARLLDHHRTAAPEPSSRSGIDHQASRRATSRSSATNVRPFDAARRSSGDDRCLLGRSKPLRNQRIGDRLLGDREVDTGAPTLDRDVLRWDILGEQDEDRCRRRLLDRLQQRGRSGSGRRVEAVDDQDLPLAFDRRPAGLHDERLRFAVAAQVVADRIEHVDVGVRLVDGKSAVAFGVVGIGSGQQLTGEDGGGPTLPGAARPTNR